LSKREATEKAYEELLELDRQYEFVYKRLEQERTMNPVNFLGVEASLSSLRIIYSLIAVAVTSILSRGIQVQFQ
jgi:hypothetical protein